MSRSFRYTLERNFAYSTVIIILFYLPGVSLSSSSAPENSPSTLKPVPGWKVGRLCCVCLPISLRFRACHFILFSVKMLPLTRMILLIPLLAALVASGEFCASSRILSFSKYAQRPVLCVCFFFFIIIPTEIGSSVDEASGYHVLKTSCSIDF